MFGADDIVSFPGADVLFVGIVIAIYAVAIYVGRKFIKKF